MVAADVTEVEHALDADHPVASELIVAADLRTADYARTFAAAEIRYKGYAGD
jgi:hypothetical protein